MTKFLYQLGRLCARHRLAVIGVWAAIAVGDRHLPEVSVEGRGYFAGRERAGEAQPVSAPAE